MQRTEMDKMKLAKIPDEIFYNNEAMMKMNFPAQFDTRNIDFNRYQNKLASIDKKRPKLADIFDDAKSRESSLESKPDKYNRASNAKTALDNDRSRQFKYTPITNPDTSFSRTGAHSDFKNVQSHLFPWDNRVESIKQMNKIIKE